MTDKIELEKEKILYKGRYLDLKKKSFRMASGKINDWEFASRTKNMAAVAVFALTEENEVILVRQYRPAVDGEVIEMPAGLLDKENETQSQAIIREMKEETGNILKKVDFIYSTYSSPGMSSEFVEVYWGRVRGKGEQELDESEEIYVYPPIPVQKLGDFLSKEEKKGYSIDYKILAAWGQMKLDGLI